MIKGSMNMLLKCAKQEDVTKLRKIQVSEHSPFDPTLFRHSKWRRKQRKAMLWPYSLARTSRTMAKETSKSIWSRSLQMMKRSLKSRLL